MRCFTEIWIAVFFTFSLAFCWTPVSAYRVDDQIILQGIKQGTRSGYLSDLSGPQSVYLSEASSMTLPADTETALRTRSGEVISSVPSPPSPFGLTWDGSNLWAGSYSGVLYMVDPSDGSVLYQMDAPGTVASGLGWDWHALWVSDRDSDAIDRVDPVSGSVLRTLASPEAWPGGLGWDGWDLFHSNYYSPSHIYYLDDVTGDIIKDFPAPMERGMGIAYDGISLWNSDYINGMIFELDPATGDIRNSFPTPDDSPHDLAYDGHYLWVVIGGGANRLYQLEPGNKVVSVGLSPTSTTVDPGGVREVTGSLVNHTAQSQTRGVMVDVYLPNGNPYPGNPVFGPLSLPLGPGASVSQTISHDIPAGAPSASFLYEAVLKINDQVVDRTSFNFNIQ